MTPMQLDSKAKHSISRVHVQFKFSEIHDVFPVSEWLTISINNCLDAAVA